MGTGRTSGVGEHRIENAIAGAVGELVILRNYWGSKECEGARYV